MDRMRTGRSQSNSVFVIYYLFLTLLPLRGFAFAARFNWRQDDDSVELGAGSTAVASGEATRTGLSVISFPTTPAATATAAPSAASNGTAVVATSASAANATVSSVGSSLNSTDDPNRCHIPHTVHVENPFCKPFDGQEVYPNMEYEVTWDPSLFPTNATNTVQLYHHHDTGLNNPDTSLLQSLNATNSQGSVFIKITENWLAGESSTSLTLVLTSDLGSGESSSFSGPDITLLANSTSESSPSSSSSSSSPSPSPSKSSNKELGEKVGIPVGLVFLIGAIGAIALFLCLRRRRGKGYRTDQSLRQVHAAAGGRGHRRNASFHDEPGRSVELQDRNRGLTGDDNWDWGSPVSSPTSASGGTRNSNAFRDEIQRQRSGKMK